MRSTIAVLRRIRINAVVTPVSRAGKLSDRHQLNGRDAELAELGKPGNDGVKSPCRRKGADVKLIKHQLWARYAMPFLIRPDKVFGSQDRRGGMHPGRLPARRRVRQFRSIVELVDVKLSLGDAFSL